MTAYQWFATIALAYYLVGLCVMLGLSFSARGGGDTGNYPNWSEAPLQMILLVVVFACGWPICLWDAKR